VGWAVRCWQLRLRDEVWSGWVGMVQMTGYGAGPPAAGHLGRLPPGHSRRGPAPTVVRADRAVPGIRRHNRDIVALAWRSSPDAFASNLDANEIPAVG